MEIYKDMNKICTSIDQSQKLVDLGIAVDTADMWYHGHCSPWESEREYDSDACPFHSMRPNWDIPAWSLSKLLGLMTTDDKKDEYYVNTESHSDYHTVSYKNCWDGCIHSEDSEESLLDAAFKMTVWLLENKKL